MIWARMKIPPAMNFPIKDVSVQSMVLKGPLTLAPIWCELCRWERIHRRAAFMWIRLRDSLQKVSTPWMMERVLKSWRMQNNEENATSIALWAKFQIPSTGWTSIMEMLRWKDQMLVEKIWCRRLTNLGCTIFRTFPKQIYQVDQVKQRHPNVDPGNQSLQLDIS